MKHFSLILFCASLHAQTPLRHTLIEIYDRPNSTAKRQTLSGAAHTILDADGSILSNFADNSLNLNSAAGASRVVLSGSGLAGFSGVETGVLTLRSGSVLNEFAAVDLRLGLFEMRQTDPGGTPRPRVRFSAGTGDGTMTLFERTAGGSEVVSIFAGSGEIAARVFSWRDQVTSPSFTRQMVVPSTGSSFIQWMWPENDGVNGDCLKRGTDTTVNGNPTGRWVFGACGSGASGVSSVTGVGLISATPTTGAVIVSCATCAGTAASNTFSGTNIFSGFETRVAQLVVTNTLTYSGTAYMQTGNTIRVTPGTNPNLGSSADPFGTTYTRDLRINNNVFIGGLIGRELTCSPSETVRGAVFYTGILVNGNCGI